MGMLVYAYDPSPGEDILVAADEAIWHANDEDQEVALLFNGLVIRVQPGSEPEEVEQAYNRTLRNMKVALGG